MYVISPHIHSQSLTDGGIQSFLAFVSIGHYRLASHGQVQWFILNTMGEMFMGELYRDFIIDRSGICLIVLCGKDVVGGVVETTQPKAFFRRLLQRWWPAFVIAG